ncbi:MAG TPA: hypothetical protein VGH27_09170 [Streptosporangiaceae bacterium]|jgi:hypothetical protein
MKDPKHREVLTNAYAIAGTPPGRNVSDRRGRIGLSESRVREREDEAIEELARWLSEMTDPVTLFGDYLAPEFYLPAPDWKSNALADPVGPDEVHPLGEVLWEQLEKTVVLNETGFATHTETRGLLRALIDGVTGYTVFYTNRGNPSPDRLRVIQGGTAGRHRADPVAGDTAALNINFEEPLARTRSLRLHWMIHLPDPLASAKPETGWAEVADVQTRNLTLRAQFDERKLPVRSLYYVARPRFLLRSIGPIRPLELQPGNLITYTWPHAQEGMAYLLAWSWPEDFKSDGQARKESGVG